MFGEIKIQFLWHNIARANTSANAQTDIVELNYSNVDFLT